MSISKEYKHVVFECDACGDVNHTGIEDFADAYFQAKSEGWIAFNDKKGEWQHRCPDCKGAKE